MLSADESRRLWIDARLLFEQAFAAGSSGGLRRFANININPMIQRNGKPNVYPFIEEAHTDPSSVGGVSFQYAYAAVG